MGFMTTLLEKQFKDSPQQSTPNQGRPLADWTDCFQSGLAPKEAPRYAYYRGEFSFSGP